MRILSIETSCDETAVAVLEATGTLESAEFTILGNALYSQIEIHREYGGVFPNLAKRAHAENLVPLMTAALKDTGMLETGTTPIDPSLEAMLAREPGLYAALSAFFASHSVPEVDAIAVTRGPGLEPALWVGVNFAQALALSWQKPLVPIDHMEGHLLISLVEGDSTSFKISNVEFPMLALLVSGGHTELIGIKNWMEYELLGTTRDDAVGEAFDKVARLLGLPYPGGPEISKLAETARGTTSDISLPRPMINSNDLDFSYSGLKTAVMYLVKGRDLSDREKADVAREFEDAAIDVLYAKTSKALLQTHAKTLLVGGGVSANAHLRSTFASKLSEEHPEVSLRLPPKSFTGDNAVMIGIAGFYRALKQDFAPVGSLTADGTLAIQG